MQELRLIRRPAAFILTINDERGQELRFAAMHISDIFTEGIGLGGVASLLWFFNECAYFVTNYCIILSYTNPMSD
jgi:hypothetical protein